MLKTKTFLSIIDQMWAVKMPNVRWQYPWTRTWTQRIHRLLLYPQHQAEFTRRRLTSQNSMKGVGLWYKETFFDIL